MTDYSKLISVIDRILTNTRFVVPNHQVARLLEYTKELERENEALKAERDELMGALSPKVVDLVRCGIGGNYGGDCYDKAIAKYYEPLASMVNKLRTNAGGDL